MKTPAEIIASLTMQDGMIENMDAGDARTILAALAAEGYAVVRADEIERLTARNAEHEARYDALEAKEEYHRKDAERLRAALVECAAPFDSGPTTIQGAAQLVAAEFQRRMEIAGRALEQNVG